MNGEHELRRRVYTTLRLSLLLTAFCISTAGAQVNPRGQVRTLTTKHFRVHFPAALDSLARLAATHAEEAWRNLSTQLPEPAGPVDLLLQDNVDVTNGFAQVFPGNRITVYVLPPVGLAELRFHDDWLRLVITHELAHIFHLDQAYGIWRVGRHILGRHPTLFPNVFTPSWVKEGLAVHFESEFTGSGRIVSTELRTVEKAAALAGNILPLDAWSAATSDFPRGQIPYAWGARLMHQIESRKRNTSMREFTRETATFPIPFLLNRAAKRGFGETFSKAFAEMKGQLISEAQTGPQGDSLWQPVTRGEQHGAWYAAYPRWRNNELLEWTASNRRDIAGLYRVQVPQAVSPMRDEALEHDRLRREQTRDANIRDGMLPSAVRVARRNSLEVNAPAPALGGDASVYSQEEFRGPYTVRSDLYVHNARGDRQLTQGARLVHPDVRASDGAIVATQIVAGSTRLVRVSVITGAITPLTNSSLAEWDEARWAPDGRHIAAVQLLRSGVQRVVLLDTLGMLTNIVVQTLGVVATPTFTPGGTRLVWASDRGAVQNSGNMQLETADISHALLGTDTLWRAEAHRASSVSTGVYQPSVSPDGKRLAALLYRSKGFAVVVSMLDTTGAIAVDRWYSSRQIVADTLLPFAASSTPYHALQQLRPRYWEPVIEQARDGGSLYGASTGGDDILGRHNYDIEASVNPRTHEVNGLFRYTYAGLGLPVVGTSFSQNWDATFRVTDTAGTALGLLARRVQLAALSFGWRVPHVRWSASYSAGAQYEIRHFTSDVDAVLGAAGSSLRRGTRYPALFLSGGIGTLARSAAGFSIEHGAALSGSVSVRRREGLAHSESWRTVGALRAFQALPLPGFARHVFALRIAGGMTDTKAPSAFSVGGVSGLETAIVPGVHLGDPSRTFPVRGFVPGAQRGLRALSGTFEYRAPLSRLSRGVGLFPLFLDRLSANAFGDAARAWCSSNTAERVASLCELPGMNDGWLASVGAELSLDLAVQYDVPYRLRFGFAKPVASPIGLSRKPSVFVTLGAFF